MDTVFLVFKEVIRAPLALALLFDINDELTASQSLPISSRFKYKHDLSSAQLSSLRL